MSIGTEAVRLVLGLAGIAAIYLGSQLFRFLKEKEFESRRDDKDFAIDKHDLRWAKTHSLLGGLLILFVAGQDFIGNPRSATDVVVIQHNEDESAILDPNLENSREFRQLLGFRDLVRLETSERAVASVELDNIKTDLSHLVHERNSRERLDKCHNWMELQAFVEEYVPYYHWAYSKERLE